MPVIYIDVLFLTNFVLDSIVLILAGTINGKKYSPLRIILGGLLGGFYGILVFFTDFSRPVSAVITFVYSCLMVAVGYCPTAKKDFSRLIAGFYLSAFLLGGALSGIFYFSGRPAVMSNGIFYFPMTTLQLFICALPLAAVLCFSFRKAKNRLLSHSKYCQVTLSVGEKSITLEGLLDSGCSLKDPYTGKPALIIDPSVAQKLFSDSPPLFRFIPYNTIKSGGIMKAFSPDLCVIQLDDNHFLCDCTVAVSPAFTGGKVIINPDIILSWRKENDIQIFGTKNKNPT